MPEGNKSPSLKLHLFIGSTIGLIAGIALIRGIETSLGAGFNIDHYWEALLGIGPGILLGGLTYFVHTLINNRFSRATDTKATD